MTETISLGSVIYTAVKPIFKIYFIIGLGFLMGKRNVLTVETSRNISDIVLTAILPCLIFDKIVSNIDNSDIKQIGIICLNAVFLFGTGLLGSYVVYLLTPVPKQWLGGCLSVGLFPNISDLPIAYIQTLDTGTVFTTADGDKGVAYICIFLAVQMIVQFNVGGYRMIQLDFDKQIKQMRADEEKMVAMEPVGRKYEPTGSSAQTMSGETGANVATENENEADDTAAEAVSLTSLSSDDDSESAENRARAGIGAGTRTGARIGARTSATARKRTSEADQHDLFLTAAPSRRRSRGLSVSHSIASVTSSTMMRNIDLRKMPSQGITDLVNEYSQADKLRDNDPTAAGLTELSIKPTHQEPAVSRQRSGVWKAVATQLFSVVENFKRPPSIALVLSITIAMIPWVKALFVTTSQASVHAAPDGLPPLSFVIDLTSYVANACVPIGLMLLGATLSRLAVGDMPRGYWKVPAGLTFLRLIFLPVVGVAFVYKLQKDNWFADDKILEFVCAVNFGLPNATSLIYLTAFYTPPDDDHFRLQMDYLSLSYIFQYPVLAISLPFLTTFILKVLLKF